MVTSNQTKSHYNLFSFNNNLLFYIVLSVFVMPIWLTEFLPMVDLPQHAAQINSLKLLLDGNEAFTEMFYVNWFTPYLVGYVSIFLFSLIFPIVIAIKIVVSISIAAMPLLAGALLKEVGANVQWRWLVIPACMGFSFYWGFLNFIVAVPIGLYFLVLSARFSRTLKLKYFVLISFFSVLLFFCHILVLGYMVVIAVSYHVGVHKVDWKSIVTRLLPYSAPLPLIVVWVLWSYQSEAMISGSRIKWGLNSWRLEAFPYNLTGLSEFGLAVAVVAIIAILPFIMGAKFNRSPERWLPFATGLAIYLLCPASAFGTELLYPRFGTFLPFVWLLAWDLPVDNKVRWHWVGILAVLVMAFINIFRFSSYDNETSDFKRVLGMMEPGKRAVSLIIDRKSSFFNAPVYLHMPAWYQATKDGVVNFNFSPLFPVMVRYRDKHIPKINRGFAWKPTTFDWNSMNGESYDYFVIRSGRDASKEVFKESTDRVELCIQSNWWWLYKNKSRDLNCSN